VEKATAPWAQMRWRNVPGTTANQPTNHVKYQPSGICILQLLESIYQTIYLLYRLNMYCMYEPYLLNQ